MNLAQQLSDYIRACCTGIWLQSYEHQDAIAEIAQLCRSENWRLVTWNLETGLRILGADETSPEQSTDPLAAIRSLRSMAAEDSTSILILQNAHRFLQSAEIVQALEQQLIQGKQHRTFVVVLAPVIQIPVELEKLFVVLEHQLPDRAQLLEIVQGIATEADELPHGQDLETVLDAASGLTRYEAESAFSLSLVRHGKIQPEAIWELKSGMLKKSGLLQLYRGGDDFSTLGGLDSLKAFCRRSLLSAGRVHGNALRKPRGLMLLSPPGCGKSQFCKALGKETGRPVLMLDVGALLGSLVGQSEERTRQALQIADAMAPCILFIDEVEKAFAGVSGSGSGDSGVSSRMFGTVLSWLNDHQSDVYVVCTANDVSRLPPEFARAERFDGVFFLDLPSRAEKDLIWQMYTELFERDANQIRPDDNHWTGAEIRACCRLSALLDLPLLQAGQNVVPVARTASESIERLRVWAGGRCLNASQPGIFQIAPSAAKTGTSRRKVSREPSMN